MFFYSDSHQIDAAYSKAQENQQKLCNLGQLTAGVVHDINNLLSSMISAVDMLHEELPNHAKKHLHTLEQTIERAEELTDGLLALLKDSPLNPEPVDPCSCVKELCHLLSESMNRNFKYEIENNLDSNKIMVHRAKLGQIILNLIVNANQSAGKDGSVNIKAYFENNTFITTISDTGTGISEEEKNNIFNPMHSTKNGTGIGLAIVKSLVEESNGKIFVSSSSKGAVFEIHIPEWQG